MYFQTKIIYRNEPGGNWIANKVLLSKMALFIAELSFASLSIINILLYY